MSIIKDPPTLDTTSKSPDKSPSPTTEDEKPSYKEQFLFIINNLTIEPMLILYCFSIGLMNLPTKSFLTLRSCRTNFNFSEAICNQLIERPENGTFNITSEDQMVQNLTNHVQSNTVPISSILPVILVLFWGSWSDRHRRRKPCIMMPMVGGAINTVILIVANLNENWPLQAIVYSSTIVTAASGGFGLMVLGVMSYIADISDTKQRTMRIGAIAMIISIVMSFGSTFSGDILKAVGALNVFLACFIIKTIGLLYGYFMVHDKNRCVKEGEQKHFIFDFFNRYAITDAFTCMLRQGTKNRRTKIVLLLIVFFLIHGPEMAEHSLGYNFMRQAFNWNEVQIGHFVPVHGVLAAIGMVFCLGVLSTHFGVHDTVLAMLGAVSRGVGHITMMLSSQSWHFFLGTSLGMFSGIGTIALKSIVSKILEPEEQGKMNSLFSIVAALAPLAFAKLMAIIYTHTVSTFPGAYFGVGAVLSIPVVIIFFWLYRRFKMEAKLDDADNNLQKTGIDNPQVVIDENMTELTCTRI